MTVTRATFDETMIPTYTPADFIPVKGAGSRLWDQAGREFIDFTAGVAVTALGHNHPKLVAALTEQAKQLWHVSNFFTNEPALKLARLLTRITFAERVFFCNSGAEANEAAFKLARKYACDHFGPDKHQILSCHNSFHGRTVLTVNIGGNPKYAHGFGPAPAGIVHFEFNNIDALNAAISDQTCAVVIEPVQGEGGVLPANLAFLQAARQLCDRHQALLVFDEVQTGIGRTGTLYAYQHFGVTPDILSSAKGLGGGFPIGAILTRAEIANSFSPGTHGTTYGGNPLACSVALAVLETVYTEEVLHGVKQRHQKFMAGLHQINERYPIFDTLRGMGLLLGCALKPAYYGQAVDLMKAAEIQQLLVLVAGQNTLRLAPSLIIENADIDTGLERLEQAIAQWIRRA